MKKKRRQRVLAVVMATLMIVGLIPTNFAMITAKADTTHTFTASTDTVVQSVIDGTVISGVPLGTPYFTVGTNSNNKRNGGGLLELKRDTLTAGGYISFTVVPNTTATVTVVARLSKTGQTSSVLLTSVSTSTSAPIAGTNTSLTTNTDATATWSNLVAGTYYLSAGIPTGGTADANVRFSSIAVVETPTGPPPTDISPVVATATATDNIATTGKINLSWTTSTTGSGNGKVRISVSKDGGATYPETIPDVAFDALQSYPYTPTASGTYQFMIQGVVNTSTLETGKTTSPTIAYVLPLATSAITATPGDGKITIGFTTVPEATGYTLNVYDSTMTLVNSLVLSGAEITAKKKDVTSLTNGQKYYFELVVDRTTPVASSTSNKVNARPYLAADDSNAIPGLSISNQISTSKATIIREAGKITIVQPATTGGFSSTGTSLTSFISAPATTGDFKMSADITVGSTAGGTGRGVFLGAFSSITATDATMQMSTAAYRGDGSGVMYNSKLATRSAEAYTTPLAAGSLKVNTKYTLTLERSGSSYISSIYSGTTLLGTKTVDSSTYGAGATNLVSGQSVIPAIAFCGVSAVVENLKITGTSTFDASTLTGSFTPFFNNWPVADVPAISNVTVNSDGTILATVDGEIGITGASKIDVAMKNSAGVVVNTQSSSTFGTSRILTFSPAASGDYTFVATASRIGETTVKTSAAANANGFILPLKVPTLWAVTGNASNLNVSWSPVPEATSYKVEYKIQGATAWTTAVASTTDVKASIPSLQAGTIYIVQVTATGALAGQTVSTQITKTLSDKEETLWKYSTFGASVSTTNDKYTDIPNGVQISSINGAGKLTGDGYDGLSFYYTEVPKTTNFVLTAKIKVDSWLLSNGQDGFMVLARDTVGDNGDSSTYNYSNSFGFVGSKVEYSWDSVDQKVSTIGDQKITMKLGIGSRTVTGIKSKSIGPAAGTFTSTQETYETSFAAQGAGSYNLIGNQKDASGNFVDPNDGRQTEFDVTLKKTNTGFEVIYTNAQGETYDEIMYDWQEMYTVDQNLAYVGFAAARNMTISVTDIKYTTSDALTDAPAQERPIELVTPNYKVTSTTATGNPNYTLVYNGNADGWVTVKDPSGNVIADNVWVTAGNDFSVDSILKKGINKFTVTFVPDSNYVPGAYQAMANYDAVEIPLTVTLKQYGVTGETIYVSPTGTDKASGNINDPMDIFTAVKYVQPGQTIVLKEGKYELSTVLTIARGINGTADASIRMIADPSATTRPVIDFMQAAAGFTAWGDYWYFRGFDITRSIDGQKGMQLSGNHCVLDQMEFYNNGNTGLQLSGASTETIDKWPSNNLILNCTS